MFSERLDKQDVVRVESMEVFLAALVKLFRDFRRVQRSRGRKRSYGPLRLTPRHNEVESREALG